LTTNAGSGNPHSATPEKGQRLMELIHEPPAALTDGVPSRLHGLVYWLFRLTDVHGTVVHGIMA
jgi:hypothetical protein